MNRPVAPWIDVLPHMHAPQKMVLDFVTRNGVLGGKSVLDVGIGNSYLSAGYALVGARVFQVDHDDACLATQRAHFKGAKLVAPTQHKLNIAEDRLPDSHWPLIFVNCCHQHLPTDEGSRHLLAEIARALAPDGTYVLTDRVTDTKATYFDSARGDPMWVRRPEELLVRLEECGLSVVKKAFFSYDFHTNAKLEPAAWIPEGQGGAVMMIVSGRRRDAPSA